MKKLFTSESVTPGHPDKLCDQISDAILDSYLKIDKYSRVAIEVCAHKNGVLVSGEVTSKANIDIEKIVRDVIVKVGYDNDAVGYNGNTIKINIDINKQSSDIACGVDNSADMNDIGAGDQGMMFGYATNETKDFLPCSIELAHKLSKTLYAAFKDKTIKYLRPDGKTQVTMVYEDDKPKYIDTLIISIQHDPIDLDILKNDIKKHVIDKCIDKKMINKDTKIYINPTGRFVLGGPVADVGLTGRKIIVDTYRSVCSHGGGAFSGKDPTKVDRSGAYYARYVAKNIVAANLCDRIEIQVSYAIGVSQPVSLYINTFNTNRVPESKIYDIIGKVFDFRLSNIIKELDLLNPMYSKTTCFGHFGKEELSWEKLDKVKLIKSLSI